MVTVFLLKFLDQTSDKRVCYFQDVMSEKKLLLSRVMSEKGITVLFGAAVH